MSGALVSFLRQDMDLKCFLETDQPSEVKQPLILAVDDDEDNLLLITQVLSLSHYSFITATNGLMALSMAEEQLPSLILLDAMLPDLDGAELVRRLRQNPQTVRIPVIAVTAMARKEDRDRLLEAGCDDYISKPYMVDDLEDLIRRYLSPLPPAF
jgi:two-component system cell cycle response regulator DivK